MGCFEVRSHLFACSAVIVHELVSHTCNCLSVSGGGGWLAINSFAAACALMAFATRREAPTGMGADAEVEVPSVACLLPVVSACCRMAPATREWAPVGIEGTPDAETVGLGGLVDTGWTTGVFFATIGTGAAGLEEDAVGFERGGAADAGLGPF